MKRFYFTFLGIIMSSQALASQPKDWQLGFQEAASSSMREIVNFHDKLLLPIIIAISVFVLFLMIYACAEMTKHMSKREQQCPIRKLHLCLWTALERPACAQ